MGERDGVLRIGLAQLACVDGDKDANLESARAAIRRAAGDGAQVVLLPEMHLTGYPPVERLAEIAETADGPALTEVRRLCRELGVAVVAGLGERDPESGRLYNVSCYVDAGGEIRAWYRKTHLFDAEHRMVSAGDSLVTLDARGGVRAGLLICFDIEFPEPARALAAAGAELLLVNSANMTPYGLYHRTFIAARAIENHCFVAYCNRIGRSARHTYVGESAIASPTGEILLDCGGDGERVAVGEIDLGALAESRHVFNYLAERRSGLTVGGTER